MMLLIIFPHVREPYVWNGLNEKVYMVFVDTDLEKMDVVGWSEFQTYVRERFRYWWCEDISSVLDRTHEVVNEEGFVVWFFDMTRCT